VRDMAYSICKARGRIKVGIKWANNFIKRMPVLDIRLGRTYESQRMLFDDPKVIQDWSTLVDNTIKKLTDKDAY
ncbi:hypothetical protein V1512DRAFT_211984, partial [Lipomyces arxii]|uniref:uncharacterized protein n=1 Tax=Lipomyces arxii TaxID=56418 RepID=UPI0034CE1F23